ncbi:chorismate-binding protein [Fodinicola feengrottensis]|uniref:chorismate-binding protein n=1 Tax=Fodinicola feengrottensis TaxID=435914 RepID=UPI0036F1F85B
MRHPPPGRGGLHPVGRRAGPRPRYAGPTGWLDAAGNGEFGIALRCAQVSGGTARLYAGGGIVADSVPENELDETYAKLAALRDALENA